MSRGEEDFIFGLNLEKQRHTYFRLLFACKNGNFKI